MEKHPFNEEIKRENITVIYGKEAYMWANSSEILEIGKQKTINSLYSSQITASRYTQIHATVEDYKRAVEYAKMDFYNHGVLNAPEFNKLLRRSKVFLGLGFPVEGPSPLEAISNGVIFIQPKFDPPKSRLTYPFFSEKPTMRQVEDFKK